MNKASSTSDNSGGQCFCEPADSTTCDKTTNNYIRYDFKNFRMGTHPRLLLIPMRAKTLIKTLPAKGCFGSWRNVGVQRI